MEHERTWFKSELQCSFAKLIWKGISCWKWLPAMKCLHPYSHTPGFPSGSDGKQSTCNAEDLGSIAVSGRSPGEGNGYSLQYSCLDNPMGREACGLWPRGWQRVRCDWATKHTGVPTPHPLIRHHFISMGLAFEQSLGVGDRQGSLACCSPSGRK